MDTFHCIEVLNMALRRYGRPEIFNSETIRWRKTRVCWQADSFLAVSFVRLSVCWFCQNRLKIGEFGDFAILSRSACLFLFHYVNHFFVAAVLFKVIFFELKNALFKHFATIWLTKLLYMRRFIGGVRRQELREE
jgi:hypothetical protein